MTGIRQTDVKGISSGNPACPPPVTCGDSPLLWGAHTGRPAAGSHWHILCSGIQGFGRVRFFLRFPGKAKVRKIPYQKLVLS